MRVHPGHVIRWRGKEHVVVLVESSFLTLRPTDDGPDVEVLAADLQYEGAPKARVSTQDILDMRILEKLDHWERRVIDVWLEELDRLDDLISAGMARSAARLQIADSVNLRLGTTYGEAKVRRQREALERHGVSGLLDQRRFGLMNAPARSYDPRVVEAVASVMADQTRKSTGTRGRVLWIAQRELAEKYGEGVVPWPSQATLYRLLQELDAGRHTFGRAVTRRTTSNQPSYTYGTRSGLRPGEQVLIDTTPMEVLIQFEGEAKRPDLTLLLCEASRSILAGIVTISTRSTDLVVVLARAMVPYSERPESMRANRRQVAQAWVGEDAQLADEFESMRDAQPYIFPESITTDRGASYVSRHFTDACRSLGISLTLAAKYTPTHKAKVERQFRTVKDQFTQYVIGFVGQSPDMKGDEAIPVEQLLTLEQLQELFEDWVAATWQNRPHKALRDPQNPRLMLSPNQMVSAYRKVAPELHMPMSSDDYIALLPTDWCAISNAGIAHANRQYDSERLTGLRRKKSPHRRHDGKWPVHYDPYNPMTVWLELGEEFVPISWRSPYNGAPMADEVWRIARAEAAARGENEPSSQHLNEVMRRFMHSGNRPLSKRVRQRANAVQADPLALTNQVPHAEPPARELPQLDVESSEQPADPVREWPDNGSFGFTRSGEED